MGQCSSKQIAKQIELQQRQHEAWEQRLLHAVIQGDLPRVRLLLLESSSSSGRGGDIRSINDGITINGGGRKVPLLHFACGAGQLEISQFLVHHLKADVNFQDATGWTPLHYACHRGRLDVARWLVCHAGAAVELRDGNGETPLLKLQSCGKIIGPGTTTTTTTMAQLQRDMFALLRFLIEEGGADARATNHDGDTLLSVLQKQNAQSTAERIMSWIKDSNGNGKSVMAYSYADFAESDYDLESSLNDFTDSSSCAYSALSLSRYHVDLESETDEFKHWYDITSSTVVGSESEETDNDGSSSSKNHKQWTVSEREASKEKKITLTEWIKYLKPLTIQTDILKATLTPDTSLDEDEDLLFDLDNAFLMGEEMIEI